MLYRHTFLASLLLCLSFTTSHAETTESPTAIASTIRGKVVEIINTAGYTYAEVDSGNSKVWAAGPVTPLKHGELIEFSTRMPMKNFHSQSMQRDFPLVYFIDRFKRDGETPADSSQHDKLKQPQTGKPVEGIDKVNNGHTIAEILADKKNLSTKNIRVRGQVVKYTANILGKNWLHIKDSSTPHDLTITTDDTVAVDDVIIVEGKLELNKDYGYGYLYPVIVVDAKITEQ